MKAICSLTLVLCALNLVARGADAPEDFPRFIVPGHEKQMESLRALYWLHYEHARPLAPLWDAWMQTPTLWPARSAEKVRDIRLRWANAMAARGLSDEGYVFTQQHDGPAHAEGWPFPAWTVAGGVGWHFRSTGIPGYEAPTSGEEGWALNGGKSAGIDERGWVVDLTEPRATLIHAGFTIAAKNSPWLRLNWWASGLEGANCYVEWTTQEQPEFSPERRMYFSPAGGMSEKETRTMIPVYRMATWTGTITQFRIGFDNAAPAKVVIKSFHTAPDTRHNINNSNFIRGCHDYFLWSGDYTFLRSQITRVRAAMRFTQREFDTRKRKCIYTTWPGHEGRSGVRWIDGKKQIVPGEGIGSNYWDLLPFGGEDALATIYYYDALLDLAELEEEIAKHPQWSIAAGADAFDPADLRKHASEVRDYGRKRFWNDKTGRFGTVDLDGVMHDYGFTFLNNEAVYYGFASAEQAKSIHAWLSGTRIVEGDTSIGADIYHWRFGPRSTTRRNTDYYYWGWSNPESVPWGYQVQDGGAVLGFSYHDLMQRLITAGADDAAGRLAEIIRWFDETQAEGGYRAYYQKDRARGSMQGGNVAGGLGLDKEFFESILVPQVMLYGFMGLRPTADGFAIDPRLPKDWPELTITRIALHDSIIDVTAKRDGSVIVSSAAGSESPIVVRTREGIKVSAEGKASVRVESH